MGQNQFYLIFLIFLGLNPILVVQASIDPTVKTLTPLPLKPIVNAADYAIDSGMIDSAKGMANDGLTWLMDAIARETECNENNGYWRGPVHGCRYDVQRCPSGQTWVGRQDMGGCESQCGPNQSWHERGTAGCFCNRGFSLNPENGSCDEVTMQGDEEPGGPGRGDGWRTLTFEDCVADNFRNPLCRQHQALREQGINERRALLENSCRETASNAAVSCATHNSHASRVHEAAIRAPERGSATDQMCRLAEQGAQSISVVEDHRTRCRRSKTTCETACNRSTTFYGESISGAANVGQCSTETDPHLQSISTMVNEFQAHNQRSQAGCTALRGEPAGESTVARTPTPTPTGETIPPVTPSTPSNDNNGPSELADGRPSGGDMLSGLSALGSSFNTGGDGNFEPAFVAPPSFKSSNSQANYSGFNGGGSSGASLSSNKRLDLGANAAPGGDDFRGLSDPRESKANTAGFQANGGPNTANNNAQGGLAGVGGNTNPQSAQLASMDNANAGSGKSRGAGRNSVAGRNLINGYKNVKPTDGGGSLSIKPGDMKRYGMRTMKTKLNEARKTFGLKVPLMFKNGKFVRDFLAMKESKGFKSRQAAMESYWKGDNAKNGVGEHECVSLNQCHTNEKASIFKLMNFRLQKSFYKVNIDI